MPEGHVTHRLARALTEAFAGNPVRVSSPQGRFAAEAESLDGSALEAAEAYGKHLFLDFGPDRVVHIHLGLIGKLWVFEGAPTSPAPLDTVRLRLARGNTTAELRGPQWCRLITDAERAAVIEGLGADPLRPDADPERAWARLRGSRRSIGSLLMDQSVTAGVGNIFRAEVLYRHGVDPHRPGRDLGRATWELVWADLVGLMAYAFEQGRIDTVWEKDSPEATGRLPRIDRHGGEVYVYRRGGMPCHVCGREIRSEVMEGRNLYWCPGCQRR